MAAPKMEKERDSASTKCSVGIAGSLENGFLRSEREGTCSFCFLEFSCIPRPAWITKSSFGNMADAWLDSQCSHVLAGWCLLFHSSVL